MADMAECEQAKELGAINSTLRYTTQNALQQRRMSSLCSSLAVAAANTPSSLIITTK